MASAISANVLKIRSLITCHWIHVTLVAMVKIITNIVAVARICEFCKCSQNSHRPPCYNWDCKVLWLILLACRCHNMGAGDFSMNPANVLKICGTLMTCMPFPLSTECYSYFIVVVFFVFFWGGVRCLSQGEGGAKRRNQSKKRVPTGMFWGHNPQSA